MKFNLNSLTRICSRGKHNSGIPCSPMEYACAAKRRTLYSTVLSTIIFHALQHSLNLPSKTKQCLVSDALSRSMKFFVASNTKLGTSTDNYTSKSSCNTCGTITTNLRIFALPPESLKETQSEYNKIIIILHKSNMT